MFTAKLGRRAYDSQLPLLLAIQAVMLLVVFGLNVYYLAKVAQATQKMEEQADRAKKSVDGFLKFLDGLAQQKQADPEAS